MISIDTVLSTLGRHEPAGDKRPMAAPPGERRARSRRIESCRGFGAHLSALHAAKAYCIADHDPVSYMGDDALALGTMAPGAS